MSKYSKYYIRCINCNHHIGDFADWFKAFQECPKCKTKRVEVVYKTDFKQLPELVSEGNKPTSMWHYFKYLPLYEETNIISRGEGAIPLEKWEFMEKFAKDYYKINCKVVAYRNDLNTATNTFKDIAASMMSSAFYEHGYKQYAVASTGNIGTALAHYLSLAGISLSVFVPSDSLKQQEAEISAYGQRIVRCKGDYHFAKKIALEYAEKFRILISGGNFDPLRIESKRTMVFEWLRLLGKMPNVYVQALSGGTGPFAIDKALRDLGESQHFQTTEWMQRLKMPRFILSQPHRCAPMAHAWTKAKADGFPYGYETYYPIYENPKTEVPTLATGNPQTYPPMAKLVHRSGGEIIEYDENKIGDVAKFIGYETAIKIGPAAAIGVGGFFEALKQNMIRNDELVLINVSESARRAPDLMEKIIYTAQDVASVDELTPNNREDFRKKLWDNVLI